MLCFNGFLSIFCTVIFQIFCFHRNHRCSYLLEAKPSPRNTKRTFIQYVDEVQQYIDVIAEATNSRRVLNAYHNGAINTFIDSLAVNAVLGVQKPPMHELELQPETSLTFAFCILFYTTSISFGYCCIPNSR